MKKIIVLLLSSLIALTFFAKTAYASDVSEWNEIVDALIKETDEVYTPYFSIVEEINNSDDAAEPFGRFSENLTDSKWDATFDSTIIVYSKYINSSNSEKAEVATLATEAATLAKDSLDLYTQAIATEDKSTSASLFDQADTKFYDAVNKHDTAVDLYNDYSGVNNSFALRNVLIGATVVLAIISGVLFIVSKSGGQLESDMVRATIYKNLLSGTFGMAIGLGLTAATYAWAVQKGGSYFIFYGPVIAGFINLVKQIVWYLKDGRKQIREIKAKENSGPVPGIYIEPTAPMKVQ